MKRILKYVIAICIVALSIIIFKLGRNFTRIQDNKEMEYEELGITSVNILEVNDKELPLGSDAYYISENEWDVNVLPDSYNTGCKEDNLTIIEGAGTYGSDNLNFNMVVNNTRICLDFGYGNAKSKNNVKVENYSFEKLPLVFYNESVVKRNITVTFTNCKFSTISGAAERGNVHYIFNNCTINNFYGSNATFNNCKFGGTYADGMNPFVDVYVNNSYFTDFNHFLESGVAHTDGVQVYGKKGVRVENVVFSNCRFEAPTTLIPNNQATINACLMVQLEYSDADGIKFNNCKINGGGYSIYAWSKGEYSLSNVEINNTYVGGAKLFGTLYPKIDDSVIVDTYDTDSLYVSSVWKDDNNKTHIIVSNDTCEERTLRVFYEVDKYKDYQIAACLGGNDLRYYEGELSYSDFPFDIDVVLDEECKWVVCFDTTSQDFDTYKQVRCVNWSESPIYVIKDITMNAEELEKQENEEEMILESKVISDQEGPTEIGVISAGICGDSIVYTLDSTGTLTLAGKGATYNYHSKSVAPWFIYADSIKEIIIEDGITSLGNQLFRNCINAEYLTLPDMLEVIGKNVFISCSSLKEVTLPYSLKSIGDYAFHGTNSLTLVTCEEEQWKNMIIGLHNDNLAKCISFTSTISKNVPNIVIEGMCGENINYVLYDDGELVLDGTGDMWNFHSKNTAPWYDYGNDIVDLNINEGILSIGAQAFRNCSSISSVSIPEGVLSINANAFIGCNNLHKIVLPRSISQIGNYAFWGTSISEINYNGNADNWTKISIGLYNQALVDCANTLFKITE